MDEFRRRPVNRLQGPDLGQSQEQAEPQAPMQASRPVQTQAAPSARSRPQGPTLDPVPPVPPSSPVVEPQDLPDLSISPTLPGSPKKKSRKRRIIWSIVAVILALALAIGGVFVWYRVQLAPVDAANETKKLVAIEAGSTPTAIADTLKNEGLIRNQTAFLWHARLTGTQNTLQAGTYRLSPSESTPEIIEHLSKGKVDTFSITFLPGATLEDNKKALLDTGYSEAEVTAAFAKTYTSPLFQGKPASADLEGYIYGETYTFSTETPVEAILERTFEEFYTVVTANDLIARYKAHGLSLYQGIILASIIQREASPDGSDMPDIAQVFYNRLAIDMQLGSDVTYQYIADKTGVARDPNLDSPYNTRRYNGLPPGPISAPGKKALLAVASPTSGHYLYFLSGDDDITYFARNLEGHEANIKHHCQAKCQIL